MSGAVAGAAASGERNQLSTLNGCFVPCLLNILGATLLLRLGFAVGMMGLAGCLGILFTAELISCITISSFSAIASNGRNGGGGAYFMISRSLGMSYGAASGVMFWISCCLAASFNVVAFTEMFQLTFVPATSWWSSKNRLASFIISSLTLLPLTGVAYKGAGAFAQVNALILAGLVVSCAAVIGSLFFAREDIDLAGGAAYTVTPFNAQTLSDNMWPDPIVSTQCHGLCSLQVVFGIVFPAVVGMMEGLNLIGDLKTPARSLPIGTYAASAVACVVYTAMAVGQAGTISRDALQHNMDVLQKSTFARGSFVVMGVATACLSTVLGSLFGAARILQAMARDDVFPGFSWFKYGTPQGDEPRPAVLMSFLLAQGALFVGNLDDLACIMTIFYLLTYCLTDMSCFWLEIFHKQDFKPSFRFYSWQTSLLNSTVLVLIMFFLNAFQATLSILIFLVAMMVATQFNKGTLPERAALRASDAKHDGTCPDHS